MTERADDAQQMALRAFILLCALGDDWDGDLVLIQSLDACGRAMSVASSIAGAACLAIDSRADVCRATLRAGACDFVVNSVDEALRILKNEIRKRKPVSVSLLLPEKAALEELAERGVAPDVFAVSDAAALDHSASIFLGFRTRIVANVGATDPILDATNLVDDYTHRRRLTLQAFEFGTAPELREFDRRLMASVPSGDARRRWAALAPGYFYRERPFRRVAYLTREEASRLG